MKRFLSFTLFVLTVFSSGFSFDVFAQESGQTESQHWARFRGPNGQGISTATNLPTKWSATENVVWKISIPGKGWSSPIIWNDHIFLTTATDDGKECRILAVDRKTGSILWNKLVFTQEVKQKNPRNSDATSTPVTDGEKVYALFADGHFVAVDFAGNIVWENKDLNYYSHHGLGTSPILYGDLLITAINPSNTEEPVRLGWQLPWDQSYLWALDKNTGKERWKGMREMSRIGHSTPVVIQVDGKDQIVSMAGDVVQSFDPVSGKLIWTVKSPGEPAVSSPAVAEGMVYAATCSGSPILSIKTDGQGDCTETHVLWKQSRNAPQTSSFLYIKPILYSSSERGTFAAHDETTGNILWQERFQGNLDSSPIYADGKIYVTSHNGITKVFKPNADPTQPAEVLAVNELATERNEVTVQATIAVSPGQLFIRTDKELWCIGK